MKYILSLSAVYLILGTTLSFEANSATYHATSLSRANCDVALKAQSQRRFFFPDQTLEDPKFAVGYTFNESLSWDPAAFFMNNKKHRAQVHSIQQRITGKRGKFYQTVNEDYFSANYVHSLGNWSAGWSNVPLTWRAYAGNNRPTQVAPKYLEVYGKHDEKIDSGMTRQSFTSAKNCNLSSW
mgnify:FL=1